MHLVQIFLPIADNDGRPFPREMFHALREELTARFGGATVYAQAPAQGFWAASDGTSRDDIVIFEVMCDRLDEPWWRARREALESEFRQEEVIVRAQTIQRL